MIANVLVSGKATFEIFARAGLLESGIREILEREINPELIQDIAIQNIRNFPDESLPLSTVSVAANFDLSVTFIANASIPYVPGSQLIEKFATTRSLASILEAPFSSANRPVAIGIRQRPLLVNEAGAIISASASPNPS